MNRRTTARRSSLFLIELILSILFFAVACSVCVQFFVKARLMSKEAARLTEAVNACTIASETISSGDSLEDISLGLDAIYPNIEIDLDTLLSDADGDETTLQLTENLSAACALKDGMLKVLLSYNVDSEDEPVYTLTVEKYLGGDTNA